jgi:hypothetical protein
MAVQLDLPQEVVEAVGSKMLQQEVLEGLLLKLVSEGRMSLGKAGGLLIEHEPLGSNPVVHRPRPCVSQSGRGGTRG